jgi:methyl coenzyme M reductase subunit D
MAGNFLDFKPKGITVTDNLKYMDRIETQERRLTGNERIDLKRKSRLATEENEFRARHARDQI